MCGAKGNFPWAKRAYLRCLNAAERHGLGDLRVRVPYLFRAETRNRRRASADVWGERAFRALGPGHPALPAPGAYDVSYHWTLEGLFAEALRLGQVLEQHFEAVSERCAGAGTVGRAMAVRRRERI